MLNNTNLRALVAYISGHLETLTDEQYDALLTQSRDGFDPFRFGETGTLLALSLIREAADIDDPAKSAGLSPFERGGKWHRAANILDSALRRESKAMLEELNAAYPAELPIGDWFFLPLMTATANALCAPQEVRWWEGE